MKPSRVLKAAPALFALLAPSAALACGGLFCNTSQPVNQSAERILFARDAQDPAVMHMHVQIQYQGPPTDFGWLLPVPPDVQTDVGSEQLFTQMDALYGPQFQLQTEFVGDCDLALAGGAPSAEADDGGGGRNGGVQVLSREAVGPYDQAILDAETVEDLRRWLDENEFQIPESTDERLQVYIDQGSVFVALKMLPGADEGDVAPLHLTFTSPVPGVPIQPTAVAADPDMGILVHVLGETRAIPLNYRHVEINDALINWVGGGQNYPDVVSHAVDEVDGGHAFVTDYAGSSEMLANSLQPISAELIDRIEGAETFGELVNMFGGTADADLARVFGLPEGFDAEGVDAGAFWQCPFCWNFDENAPIDGMAMAAQLREEVNPAREHLVELAQHHPYLTRLYTTLSPEEMNRDPLFAFNSDLPAVPNIRTATQVIDCRDDNFQAQSITTPSGYVIALEDGAQPETVVRQDGETIRGADSTGAAVVSSFFESGPPMIITDNREEISQDYSGGAGEDGGCDCNATSNNATAPWLLGLVGLLGLRRRRR
ncbi:MAG: DUF2330 domain-containing protein [Bradymonadia bacterium]